MVGSFVMKSIEFLIGFIALPRVVTLISVFVIPYFHLGVQPAIIATIALSFVLIVVTYFIRKIAAVGFLAGTLWFFLKGYMALTP